MRDSFSAAATLSGSLLAGLFVIGCASPGNPKPPSLHLPDHVTDMTAERIGDRVKIAWTPPTRTTDGVDITFPVTVALCRDLALPAPAVKPPKPLPPPCTVVKQISGHAGPSTTEDLLPASFTTGSRMAVAYRIRLLNPAGKGTDAAPPVYVPSGPAEPPVPAFRVTQTRRGVVLEWAETPPGTAVEVTRTLIGAPVKPVAAAKPQEKGVPVGKKKDPEAPVLLRPSIPANGMVDITPVPSESYRYTAQRISDVALRGRPLQLRSEPTPAITVALRDTFSPDAPRDLVSIPGRLKDQPTVDLSWDANSESDLAGYRVYRVDLADAGAPPRLLTHELVVGPAYRDTTILPSHRYRYQVTAVDRSGNESPVSASVEDGS